MQLDFQQRLELNSAIAAVFDEKFDEEILRTIIGYCRNLESYKGEVKIIRRGGSDSTSVSGCTNEAGNQEVRVDDEKDRTWKVGSEEFRVGDFKIARTGRTLSLRRFWASDLTTNADDEPPLTYELRFDSKTFSPVFVAKIGTRTVLDIDNRMLRFLFKTEHRSVIWGDKKKDGSCSGPLMAYEPRSWQGVLIISFVLWVALTVLLWGIYLACLSLFHLCQTLF